MSTLQNSKSHIPIPQQPHITTTTTKHQTPKSTEIMRSKHELSSLSLPKTKDPCPKSPKGRNFQQSTAKDTNIAARVKVTSSLPLSSPQNQKTTKIDYIKHSQRPK